MKKYIIMVIMICFFAVPFTAFAEENNNNIQKKTLQQQVEQQYIEPEDYIPVLMYHHFKTEEVEPGNGANMHIDEFEEHMKTLQQAGYTPIFLSELYDIMKQAQIEKETGVVVPELQLDKKYVVITIDDGYRSNYELAYPLLQKYNMKACISVITSRIHTGYVYSSKEIEKMSWENLNEMQNSGLVEIYSHTYDHEPVGDRIYTDVRSSIQKGEEMLDKQLENRSPVSVLTYPNGNYRKNIALLMYIYMGYDLQLTTNSDVVNRNTSVLEVPRITVNSGWTGEQLLQKIEQTAQKTFQQ
ncbi:MAG: polysaccharide deacetylase family protein [Firmicutes bacterium]|jgi:peptidoglycan/xylan/chitin deacetylase (PgdA/CDA1 family)|nr:polysaccharide deacetylase family protein [Bacillota bacterium]